MYKICHLCIYSISVYHLSIYVSSVYHDDYHQSICHHLLIYFETWFYYVTLARLELAVWTRLAPVIHLSLLLTS